MENKKKIKILEKLETVKIKSKLKLEPIYFLWEKLILISLLSFFYIIFYI